MDIYTGIKLFIVGAAFGLMLGNLLKFRTQQPPVVEEYLRWKKRQEHNDKLYKDRLKMEQKKR